MEYMMDEITQAKFEEKLKALLAMAKKKKNILEYQEINDFFSDMQLEEEQFEKILEILEQNNVDILRITDDDDDELIEDEETCPRIAAKSFINLPPFISLLIEVLIISFNAFMNW